jgi:hypothetical protein
MPAAAVSRCARGDRCLICGYSGYTALDAGEKRNARMRMAKVELEMCGVAIVGVSVSGADWGRVHGYVCMTQFARQGSPVFAAKLLVLMRDGFANIARTHE